jgi:hypothetical protein
MSFQTALMQINLAWILVPFTPVGPQNLRLSGRALIWDGRALDHVATADAITLIKRDLDHRTHGGDGLLVGADTDNVGQAHQCETNQSNGEEEPEEWTSQLPILRLAKACYGKTQRDDIWLSQPLNAPHFPGSYW